MIEWIETTFNVSGGFAQTIAVILALFVVLLLFSLFVFVLRRLMGSKLPQSRSRQPRIAVMDSATVDTKRRLVLIRRDNIEHLLLIGGPSDVVVEQHIVRNAPLASGRPGAPIGTGQAASAPIRTPTAPGPDIPLTPEDTHLPPAPQAPAAKTPPSPLQAPTPSPAASTAPNVRQVSRSEPAAAVSAAAPEMSPSVTSTPVNPFKQDLPSNTATEKEPPGRAADLLRAAAQNGFKRTKPKQDASETPPESSASEPLPVAPEIRPEPAAPEKKATSKFKSLTRPFSPKERPSYGTHSITPPASGPAARAKTALSAPVEAPKGAPKTEPSLGSAPSNQSQPAEGTAASSAPQPQQDTPLNLDPAVAPATGQDIGSAEAHTASEHDGTAAPKDGDKAETQASGNQTDPSPKAAPAAPAEPKTGTKELNLELEVDDLIFDETENGQDAASQQEDAPKVADVQADDTSPDKSKEKAKAPEVNVSKTSGGASKAPDVKAPAKAAAPTASLADKNPIEDEMAKILDELVGQPN